jgi:hypothetical protein
LHQELSLSVWFQQSRGVEPLLSHGFVTGKEIRKRKEKKRQEKEENLSQPVVQKEKGTNEKPIKKGYKWKRNDKIN